MLYATCLDLFIQVLLSLCWYLFILAVLFLLARHFYSTVCVFNFLFKILHVSKDMKCFLCVVFSFNVVSSKFTHFDIHGWISFKNRQSWVQFCFMYISFSLLFIHQEGLFPYPGSCFYCCNEHRSVSVFVLVFLFGLHHLTFTSVHSRSILLLILFLTF